MSFYKVTGPTPVLDNEPGATFEHTFSASEEADLLDRARLTLVPRPYRNIADRDFVTPDGVSHVPGETFDAALTVAQEQALLEGGHLELGEKKRRPAASPKKES